MVPYKHRTVILMELHNLHVLVPTAENKALLSTLGMINMSLKSTMFVAPSF